MYDTFDQDLKVTLKAPKLTTINQRKTCKIITSVYRLTINLNNILGT
jgi:hypothetical protein